MWSKKSKIEHEILVETQEEPMLVVVSLIGIIFAVWLDPHCKVVELLEVVG